MGLRTSLAAMCPSASGTMISARSSSGDRGRGRSVQMGEQGGDRFPRSRWARKARHCHGARNQAPRGASQTGRAAETEPAPKRIVDAVEVGREHRRALPAPSTPERMRAAHASGGAKHTHDPDRSCRPSD